MTNAERIEDMNRELRGQTYVKQLEFECEFESGVCSVRIVLARSASENSPGVIAAFTGVTGLSIRSFGGGITQVMCLRLKDVTSEQMDRVSYALEELEHGNIVLRCRDAAVKPVENVNALSQ